MSSFSTARYLRSSLLQIEEYRGMNVIYIRGFLVCLALHGTIPPNAVSSSSTAMSTLTAGLTTRRSAWTSRRRTVPDPTARAGG
jgi:hypothetical protein